MWLRIFKHLLPDGKAFLITIEKKLTQFFRGIANSVFPLAKSYLDSLITDLFPATTRQLDEWGDEFGFISVITDEQEKRDRLSARWQQQGGQSPYYIQTTLRNAGFDVYVHEWWLTPDGLTIQDPRQILRDALNPQIQADISTHGNDEAQHGSGQHGASTTANGVPLVNKIPFSVDAGTGEITNKDYPVSGVPAEWVYYFYIGAEVFPNHANVLASQREEFERLILSFKPTHMHCGLLIDYI
jgi:uncharacterized protein YmfQ (DUF2313 family)